MIGGYDLKDIVLIDNAVWSFAFQLDNGIPIVEFSYNKDDDQLLKLKEYLPILAGASDCRKSIRKNFKLHVLKNSNLESMVDLYEEVDNESLTESVGTLQNISIKAQRLETQSFTAKTKKRRKTNKYSRGKMLLKVHSSNT